MVTQLSRAALLFACASLAACTTADAAPLISDLSYSPNTVSVGSQATINGSLNFDDPDGDADLLGVGVLTPSGAYQELPPLSATGIEDLELGTVAFTLFLNATEPGDYEIDVWLVDVANNESNVLTGVVFAQ